MERTESEVYARGCDVAFQDSDMVSVNVNLYIAGQQMLTAAAQLVGR